ncbi:MAG: hypothetical protein JO038_00095 [Alphaproteobacteria bacterium]|nr:hypothetical protein [Alphaproteobacteria bacterium]
MSELGAGWLPAVAVAALTAIALAQTMLLPLPVRSALLWAGGAVLCGGIALVGAVSQQGATAALDEQAAQIQAFWERLAALDAAVPEGSEAKPEDIFAAASDTISALRAKVASLQDEIKAVKEKYRNRTVGDEAAAGMAAYLKQYGPHRVVVSCAPDDVEAFTYANQITNVLKAAGWDAHGPEPTALFGSAMGINLFVHGAQAPEVAKILLGAFARFNIPYQSRVAPNNAIPDAQTVELFVGAKP